MNKTIIDKINQLNIEALDLWLKPTLSEACVLTSDMAYQGGRKTLDYKNISDDLRLVGTKKQIDDFWITNKLQVKDSWKCKVTEKHLNGYIKNNHKLLIIQLI